MVILFSFEFIEGKPYRHTALFHAPAPADVRGTQGRPVHAGTRKGAAEQVPTFTHFLDLPMLFLIVALGAIRPETWTCLSGLVVSVLLAAVLTFYIPRLYLWGRG